MKHATFNETFEKCMNELRSKSTRDSIKIVRFVTSLRAMTPGYIFKIKDNLTFGCWTHDFFGTNMGRLSTAYPPTIINIKGTCTIVSRQSFSVCAKDLVYKKTLFNLSNIDDVIDWLSDESKSFDINWLIPRFRGDPPSAAAQRMAQLMFKRLISDVRSITAACFDCMIISSTGYIGTTSSPALLSMHRNHWSLF